MWKLYIEKFLRNKLAKAGVFIILVLILIAIFEGSIFASV